MSTIQNGANVEYTPISPELRRNQLLQENKSSSEIQQQVAKQLNVEQKAQQVKNNNDVEISATTASETKQPLNSKQLDKVAQQLQDFVNELNVGLDFSVDKASGKDVIKVIDKNTGDVVKQFPSEEVLTLMSKLSEMLGGFVDAKV